MDFYNTHTFAMSTLFIFFFSVLNQWTGVEGWSYHYSDTTMAWVEAREWCKENYTDMVAIQNRDEIEYLNTVIPKATTGYYWIGIRKINGIWTWVGTNKHLTAEAENWAKGEPNNGGNNEDCVEMYIKRGTDDGKWNDEHCQKKKSALCYTASCKKDSCSPNGECVETINSHQCECFEGFYGKKCEHVVICEEKYISAPENGSVQCSHAFGNFSYKSECKYSCNEGYQLVGAKVTECGATKAWSNTPPTCELVQCPGIETPQDGSVSCTDQTLSLGSVCSFSCIEGFILEGASSTECTKTGDWSANVPKCTAVQCPAVKTPQDGSVSCTDQTLSLGSVCSFSCSEGFILEGASSTECTKTGEWSADVPKCTAVRCPTLEEPLEGKMKCTGDSYGNQCTFSCNNGYQLLGVSELTCTKTAQWSQVTPSCTAVQCPAVKTPQDGSVSCTDQTLSLGSVCSFNCIEGFILEGASSTECTKTGDWSTDVPKCTVVQCPAVKTPQDGSVSCTDQTLSLGSVCSFSCSEGFILEGASSTGCTKTGEWGADVPKCTAVRCPTLEEPLGGKMKCTGDSYGNQCTFSCNNGYQLLGVSELTCTKTAQWSQVTPSCTAVQCPAVKTPQDGSVSCTDQTLSLGSVCSFNCIEGFILEGASSTECTKTGDWSADVPRCTAVQCPAVKTPQDGSVSCTDQTLSLGSVCSFSCSEGFILEGASSTECTKTGEWSADVPKCTAVRCPYLQDLINGLRNCSSEENLFSTACSFSCLNGYELQGHQIVMCSLSGNWTGEVPECKEVQSEHSLSLVSGVTIGVGSAAALSSLGFAFWIMKRLRKLKAKKFDLSNSDIDVPPQQYKSFDSLI
ncbi:E-selectin-like isoform X1 [Silurus meridionalis]|uniref:E-selectin-like isoform X1 n=1 Tax=Silurus meridionalis TaxID=175797 RepID=UPI001EECD71C|nr:E-selectin-like isoform X1 [Silurus meridionalis]